MSLRDVADDGEEQSTADQTDERQTRIEASLLYLFSGYDACAAGILQLPPPESEPDSPLIDQARAWVFDRLERLCRLALVPEIDTEFTFELTGPE